MINDITTSLVSKNITDTSSARKNTLSEVNQKRQEVVLDEGKVLPTVADESVEVDRQALQEAVSSLNEHLQQIQRNLLFSVDESSGKTIVKVVNASTDEVIRQIPTEEVLRISHNIQEQLDDISGLIFETSA